MKQQLISSNTALQVGGTHNEKDQIMAQSGFTPIQIYASSTTGNVPATGNLTNSASGSEVAINITDGKLFYKDNVGAIQVIATKAAAAGTLTNPLITGIRETLYSDGSGATGTNAFYTLYQAIIYLKGSATSNWGLNFTGNPTTTLNSLMANGQSLSLTYMAYQGATAYVPTIFYIDGVQQYPKWQGGIAPTAGNPYSTDVYTFAIIKDLVGAYTILASQTKFA